MFRNLKIFYKILFLALILMIILTAQGASSIISLKQIDMHSRDMYENQLISALQSGEIRASILTNDINLKAHMESLEPDEMERIEGEIKKQKENVNMALETYKSTYLDEEEEMLLSKIDQVMEGVSPCF